ncbi:MAG: 4-hydroxy-tetrahydrodipicolinate reductase [Chloroflexi bacterium]|jgi:4-hydroxy-tetrahydrodipicolinate reductase|nr:4-hydroxy-tetrahydrodipicolinate reductase [Chloroflexota bacterium]MBT7081636.1 4-hydroxy-tetrahydrodipicolinate reductase [Chloroflexota bacterium]
MSEIRVIIHGAAGRMGVEVLRAVCADPGLVAVGAVDVTAGGDLALPDGSGLIPFSSDVADIINRTKPDVMVDFTTHAVTMPAVLSAIQNGVRPVIGTTGQSAQEMDEIAALCEQTGTGAFMAPNFSLGAVMMMHLSKIAAKYFDYAEIIELHHEKKLDSPSGTAMLTAKDIVESRGKPFLHTDSEKETLDGARGGNYEGVSVHSVRLPGYLAHQEVIFGSLGQTLKIRHDSINRESFMPGVVLAVKEVMKLDSLIIGLDKLLGL